MIKRLKGFLRRRSNPEPSVSDDDVSGDVDMGDASSSSSEESDYGSLEEEEEEKQEEKQENVSEEKDDDELCLQEYLDYADDELSKTPGRVYKMMVDFIEPDNILSQFRSSGELHYMDVRQMQEMCDKREKSRKLLNKVKKAGPEAYTKLKEYLRGNDQPLLAEFLESNERREGTCNVRKILAEHKLPQVVADERTLAGLRQAMIQYYRRMEGGISICPLVEQNDDPFEDVYVAPHMSQLEMRFPLSEPVKHHVESVRGLLFKDNGTPYIDVYCMAKAGVGKTVFCKRLCMLWCQAHRPLGSLTRVFPPDDVACMKYFDFVFLISMTEFSKTFYDLEAFIIAFIFEKLPSKWWEREVIDRAMDHMRCLVLLDGFDEWVHPEKCNYRHHRSEDIPHRRRRLKMTILTTLRPWRFDAIRLTSSMYDNIIYIHEMNDRTLEHLASKAVTYLNKLAPENVKKSLVGFSTANLGNVRALPYIYSQFLCLWYENKPVGGSKCEVYTAVVETTFNRGIQKYKSTTVVEGKSEVPADWNVPEGIKRISGCSPYHGLLIKLGRLAFYMLYSTENDQKFMFEVDDCKGYLTFDEIDFFVKVGFLTRRKGYGIISRRVSNVHFQHKTVQDYLAALYLQTCVTVPEDDRNKAYREKRDKRGPLVVVADLFKTLEGVLSMTDILIFVSGLNSNAFVHLDEIITNGINADKNVVKYRSGVSWVDDRPERGVIVDYQQTAIDCVQEMERNGQPIYPLPLLDVFVNRKCRSEQYTAALKALVQHSSTNVKSLSVRGLSSTEEVTEVFEKFDISKFCSLEKLELCSAARLEDVEKLLEQSSSTLRALYLRLTRTTTVWPPGEGDGTIVLSETVGRAIFSLPCLQALYLDSVITAHDKIMAVFDFLNSRVNLVEIGLEQIQCTDHKTSCNGLVLDLSHHEQIRKAHLINAPLSQLRINKGNLETCFIGRLRPEVTTSWLSDVAASERLTRLVCWDLPVEALPVLLRTIPSLLQLEYLTVGCIDLGNSVVQMSSAMLCLIGIQFRSVSMTTHALRSILKEVDKPAHPFAVGFCGCKVTPKDEYDMIKSAIRRMDTFTVVQDGDDRFGQNQFCLNKEGKRVYIGLNPDVS